MTAGRHPLLYSQESLDEEHQDTLEEVEEVCRGFLEVAKVRGRVGGRGEGEGGE
jgi:hypothetical protein